jgi:hypothetical protein
MILILPHPGACHPPSRAVQEECVALIMGELARRGRPNPHTLAYQSRVGPVEWLKPYTDDSIRWVVLGLAPDMPTGNRQGGREVGSFRGEPSEGQHGPLAFASAVIPPPAPPSDAAPLAHP